MASGVIWSKSQNPSNGIQDSSESGPHHPDSPLTTYSFSYKPLITFTSVTLAPSLVLSNPSIRVCPSSPDHTLPPDILKAPSGTLRALLQESDSL